MYKKQNNPVKEIPMGEALKITLDNYYDLLKEKTGGLGSGEYLQLKLVADTIDIANPSAEQIYTWHSYYNLLKRTDLAIEPSPITDTVLTGSTKLVSVYGRFLRKLRTLVVYNELSQDDIDKLAFLDEDLRALKSQARDLFKLDKADWKEHCEATGTDIGDSSMYVQWSSRFGYLDEIEKINNKITRKKFERNTIINRKYPNQEDQEIVNAEIEFNSVGMRLRYPTSPDYEYASAPFKIEYLARLPAGSTGMYDDRHFIGWDKTPAKIQNEVVGSFEVGLDSTSQSSSSIKTDWGGSGGFRGGLFSVKAGTSGFTNISEDFKKTQKITLSASATMRLNVNYASWFKPELFNHKRVRENIDMFEEFFGEAGSLLYYPTSLILLRGFGVEFESSAEWTYDYEKKFKASGGGGFRAFGIRFGGRAKYSKHEKSHKVEKTGTKLKIYDDPNSIRFVGYVLKKNTISEDSIKESINSLLDEK